MGVKSLADAHAEVYEGTIRFEIRSPSAQKEGGVHDLHSYTRKLYAWLNLVTDLLRRVAASWGGFGDG